MKRDSLISLIFSITIIISVFHEVSLTPWKPCKPCMTDAECDMEPPQLCPWGENRDTCGRRVCSKGPGERCGGAFRALGECGEGLMCKGDEKCHGCSLITLDCYN